MDDSRNDLEKLASMIKDIKFTMMTTVSGDGSIHSRPMATQKLDTKNFDGVLWFFSKKNSHKNHAIENDQHVNLAFADTDKQHYISVSGRATVTEDRQKMKELWNPALSTWFPDGLEDPEISLIGVAVEEAEIWDSPPSAVVHLAGFIKAKVTGRPVDQNLGSQHVDVSTRQ